MSSEAQYQKRKASWLKKQATGPVMPFMGKPNGTDLSVTPVEPLPRMLVGWTAIADYLGVSVAVTQRFHRDYGLPVIRIARRRAFIHRDAVVEWFFRLDRMQRKFIDEAIEKLAPGTRPGTAHRTWIKYVKEKGREGAESIDTATFE